MESVSFCFWALSCDVIKFQPLIIILISGNHVSRSRTESVGDPDYPLDQVANGLLLLKLNRGDTVHVLTRGDKLNIYGHENSLFSYFQIMLVYNA